MSVSRLLGIAAPRRVLAWAQVSDVADPPDGETTTVTVDFTKSELGLAQVKAGRRYALVVRGAGSAYPFLQINLNGGCEGALFGYDGDTDKWVRLFGDLVFTTFVKRS